MINILEYINDYFAFPKHHILSDTRLMVRTIHEHLIKLIVFETSRDIEHWKKEITSYLMKIQEPKLKGNIKIKPAKYFEILFEHPIDPKEPYFDSYLWKVTKRLLYDEDYEKEYSKYRVINKSKVNTELIDLIYNNIKIFMKSISLYMSKRDITREDIKKELEKYIENIQDK
jgi:hypothetical protein